MSLCLTIIAVAAAVYVLLHIGEILEFIFGLVLVIGCLLLAPACLAVLGLIVYLLVR